MVASITEWLKIAHMADRHNMQISPHFVMELHLPLVGAIPDGLFAEYIPSLDPVLTEHVGDTLALGINMNWQKLKQNEVAL